MIKRLRAYQQNYKKQSCTYEERANLGRGKGLKTRRGSEQLPKCNKDCANIVAISIQKNVLGALWLALSCLKEVRAARRKTNGVGRVRNKAKRKARGTKTKPKESQRE